MGDYFYSTHLGLNAEPKSIVKISMPTYRGLPLYLQDCGSESKIRASSILGPIPRQPHHLPVKYYILGDPLMFPPVKPSPRISIKKIMMRCIKSSRQPSIRTSITQAKDHQYKTNKKMRCIKASRQPSIRTSITQAKDHQYKILLAWVIIIRGGGGQTGMQF